MDRSITPMFSVGYYGHREPAPLAPVGLNESWDRYSKIESTTIITSGGPGGWEVFEAKSSFHLFNELHRCGQEGKAIEGMICPRGALSRRSLRGLNAFLRHSKGLWLFWRVQLQKNAYKPKCKYAWEDFQAFVGFTWQR